MAGRIGILTGGGDCPGLNAVIRAVTRRSLDRGYDVTGVREGWRGMVDRLFEPLDYRAISGLLPRGGTILGTSRTNPYKSEGGVERWRGPWGGTPLSLNGLRGTTCVASATRSAATQ